MLETPQGSAREPLVSVVTPFHNTAPYLAECIESVLAQSYGRFEYILVDNCSTDGSGQIAENYTRQDPRLRLIRRKELLTQVQNYNAALAEISETSEYCKIVQADDWIFPDCLKLMVRAFQKSESIGLVSSYDLKGDSVRGSGFPLHPEVMSGKEVGRLYLRGGAYVFGSPTTVMYRSSLVRAEKLFYQEGLLHEDTEKCMQILENWDFAFVPQVLSFLRTENESISSAVRKFAPGLLDHYIIVRRYASAFLEASEAAQLTKRIKRDYYRQLARAVMGLRDAGFWKYHRHGLKTLGETVDRLYLTVQLLREMLWLVVNPGMTLQAVLRNVERRERS